MQNTITLEKNQIIIINGAILNPTNLSQIAKLQDNGNDYIDNFRETINNSICAILQLSQGYDSTANDEILLLTRNLTYCREYLEDLRKPTNF